MPAYLYPDSTSDQFLTKTGVQTITGEKTFNAIAHFGSTGTLISGGTGRMVIRTNLASYPALDIGAATGQTANILEIRDASGAVRTSVDFAGQLKSIMFFGEAHAANQRPVTVRGFSGQTASLTEWQDSAGSLLSSVTNLGIILSNVGFQGGGTAYLNMQSNRDPMVYLAPSTATSRALVLRGATSQTAHLTQWQDPAGNSISWADSVGNFRFNRATVRGDFSTVFSINNAGEPGTPAFKIIAAASQTADLQQWQNSAGTNIARIGRLGFAQFNYYVGDPTLGLIFNNSADTVNMVRFFNDQTQQHWIVDQTAGTGTAFAGIRHTPVPATPDRYFGFTFEAAAQATGGANGIAAGSQAGMLVRSSGSYGTMIYLQTTDSYASGMKDTVRINQLGDMYLFRGAYGSVSRADQKKNITRMSQHYKTTDKVKNMRPIRFQMKDSPADSRYKLSLSAEEVAANIPEAAVYEDDGTVIGVDLLGLNSVALNAVIELVERLESVEAELAALRGNK